MQGLQLVADLRGCRPREPLMADADALRALCMQAVREAGLSPVGELFHPFVGTPGQPAGVTGVVLLAESHLAVHTWPERGVVTLDVYVCNVSEDNGLRAQGLLDALLEAFAPSAAECQRVMRGSSEPSV